MKTYKEFILEAMPKRVQLVKLHHGTPETSAEKIKKSGFNTSDVHASTSRDIAKSFGNRYSGKTKVITFRVPKKDIKDAPPSKIVRTSGQRGVDKWGREHYSTIMDPKYATKHISKEPEGVIDAPKIGKDFQKRYFENNPNSRFKQRTRTRLLKQ